MRNLKKVLGLVLCLAMMLSIMVVGAGAAFTDQSNIDTKHQEAVDACSSLNIITGFPNGSFQPNEAVTREQSAKMICVLLNGGKDPVLGSAVSSFTDVANDRWSCPYIESCVSQDIIVGIGGNKFAPAGKVTGSQLAKMLLVALGYSPDHQKYAGSAWEVNVNTDASAKGFYKDLEDIDPSQPLSREHAAQMIWNALNAYEVEYQNQLVTDENGQLTSKAVVKDRTDINNNKITLLQDKYGIAVWTGILVSVEKNAGKETYSIQVDNEVYSSVDKDYSDLLGQEVKVMEQKPDKVGDEWTVIGVYATENNKVETAQKGDMDDLDTDKATINGTSYKPDAKFATMNDVPVFFTCGVVYEDNDGTVGDLADYQTLCMIDNNGDGKIDLAICTPVVFGQIDTLTEDEINLSYIPGTEVGNFDLEDDDIDVYDGAAEDDYVIVTPGAYTVTGDTIVIKADMVNGTVTATKGADPVSKKVDGTWYDVVEETNELSTKLGLNKTFDMAVYGNYVFAADKDPGSANADDVLFVDDAANFGTGLAAKDQKVEANVVFSDGSTATITISKVYPAGAEDSEKAGVFGFDKLIDRMWMFEQDGDDYILTELYQNSDSDKESLSYDGYTAPEGMDLKDGKQVNGKLRVEDNSIVFVKASDGDDSEVKVLSGKDVAGWSESNGKDVQVESLYDKSNGYQYIQVGAILVGGTDTVPGSSDLHYGYVVSAPETSKEGSTSYITVTVWNGTEEVTITGKKDDMGNVAKGDFVSYTDKTSEYVKIEETKTIDAAEQLTAYDDESVTLSTTGSKDLADGYVVIGVNVNDKAGTTGKLKVADAKYNNVIVFTEDGGTKGDVAAVFIASNNNMSDYTIGNDTEVTTPAENGAAG